MKEIKNGLLTRHLKEEEEITFESLEKELKRIMNGIEGDRDRVLYTGLEGARQFEEAVREEFRSSIGIPDTVIPTTSVRMEIMDLSETPTRVAPETRSVIEGMTDLEMMDYMDSLDNTEE